MTRVKYNFSGMNVKKREADISMATSSIFHNIVIKDEATALKFIAALEASEADPYKRPVGPVTQVTADKNEIHRICDLWRKNYGGMNDYRRS